MNVLASEELRQLAEVGFLAGAAGDLPAARSIFGALELFRPRTGLPYIGLAMALLNRRAHDEAVQTLERGLTMAGEEHAADLHAVRALALQLAGRHSESARAARAAGDHPMSLALTGSAPVRR